MLSDNRFDRGYKSVHVMGIGRRMGARKVDENPRDVVHEPDLQTSMVFRRH